MALTKVDAQLLNGAVTTDSSGNVGIGTTSPTAKLHVVGGQTTVTGSSGNGAYSRWYNNAQTTGDLQIGQGWTSGSDNLAFINNNSNAPLMFATNGTERMRLASDGVIGFGTTTWTGTTGISMSSASDSATYGKAMYFNSPYNGTRNAISFGYNTSGVGAIVTGTSTTSYNTSSDYRLKDNVAPLTGSGAFIDGLQPKTWTWKVDGKAGVGFIAHEAQVVAPQSVHGEKDATDADGNPVLQSMEYGSAEFIANMIAELQDLRKRVAVLEAK